MVINKTCTRSEHEHASLINAYRNRACLAGLLYECQAVVGGGGLTRPRSASVPMSSLGVGRTTVNDQGFSVALYKVMMVIRRGDCKPPGTQLMHGGGRGYECIAWCRKRVHEYPSFLPPARW